MTDEQFRLLVQQHRRTMLEVRALLLSHYPDGWDVEFSFNEAERTLRLTPEPPKGA